MGLIGKNIILFATKKNTIGLNEPPPPAKFLIVFPMPFEFDVVKMSFSWVGIKFLLWILLKAVFLKGLCTE